VGKVEKGDNLEELNAALLLKLRKFNNGMDALNIRRKNKRKDLRKITKLEKKILGILEDKMAVNRVPTKPQNRGLDYSGDYGPVYVPQVVNLGYAEGPGLNHHYVPESYGVDYGLDYVDQPVIIPLYNNNDYSVVKEPVMDDFDYYSTNEDVPTETEGSEYYYDANGTMLKNRGLVIPDSNNPNGFSKVPETSGDLQDMPGVQNMRGVQNLNQLKRKQKVINMQKVKNIQRVKSKQRVKSINNVKNKMAIKNMQRVKKMQRVKSMNKVKSMRGVTKMEPIKQVIELSPAEVQTLKRMMQ